MDIIAERNREWFDTWIKALSMEKTAIIAREAGTIVAYGDEDLTMLDADCRVVAVILP